MHLPMMKNMAASSGTRLRALEETPSDSVSRPTVLLGLSCLGLK